MAQLGIESPSCQNACRREIGGEATTGGRRVRRSIQRWAPIAVGAAAIALTTSACDFAGGFTGSTGKVGAATFKINVTDAHPSFEQPVIATALTVVVATTSPVNSEESSDWSYNVDNCIGGVVSCSFQQQVASWETGFLPSGGAMTASFDIPTAASGTQEISQDLEGCQFESDPTPCTDNWGAGEKDKAEYDVGLPYLNLSQSKR